MTRILTAITALIALLAGFAAAAGLLAPGGSGQFTFTSVHGVAVAMYGQGLYEHDSLLIGSGFRGADAVVLVAGLPLLLGSLVAYRRGSLRGHLVLVGALAFFLYQYASMAFGAAFNPIFPVYIALFGLSLYAFVAAAASVDLARLERAVSPHLPVRGVAAYLFAVFAVLVVVWGSQLAADLLAGHPLDRMDNYTTIITDVLDLGIILPAMLVGGVLVLRRSALGYLVASTTLVLCVLMGPTLTALTVSQVGAGIAFTPGEIVGPVMGFMVVALVGIAVAVVMLRHIAEPAPRVTAERERERVAASA